MEYGVNIPVSSPLGTPEVIAEAARRAEELGFSAVWVGDHVALPTQVRSPYPYSADGKLEMDVETPWLDPFLALTWAAASTSTIRLGTAVLVLAMRPPVLAAKQLATLDLLSGGRLLVGVGAGWLAEEFELLGQPFERRGARLDEAIDILRACWSPGPVEFHGRFSDLAEFAFEPKPAQARVPILIGGASDAALRRVTRRGDGWIPIGLDPEALAERLAAMRRLMDEAGRSMDELLIVLQLDTAEHFDGATAQAYAELGVTHLFTEISWRGTTAEWALERMAEIAALARAA